jgi:hypothetical protein
MPRSWCWERYIQVTVVIDQEANERKAYTNIYVDGKRIDASFGGIHFWSKGEREAQSKRAKDEMSAFWRVDKRVTLCVEEKGEIAAMKAFDQKAVGARPLSRRHGGTAEGSLPPLSRILFDDFQLHRFVPACPGEPGELCTRFRQERLTPGDFEASL